MEVNKMCLNCKKHIEGKCGTIEKVWTGCAMKEAIRCYTKKR